MPAAVMDRQPTAPHRLPAIWTVAHVKARLVEAFEVNRRLPAVRGPRSSGSSWPVAVKHEFADMVGWDNPQDDARARVWSSWQRQRGAQAFEVSRMEEALDWLSLLAASHPGACRCLQIWARLSVVRRPSLAKAIRRMGCSKQTFYRRVNEGSLRIADRLNRQGVVVR